MNFQIEQFNTIDEAEWRLLSVGASFYTSPEWITACQKALSGNAIMLTLRDKGKILGGMPAIITSRIGMKTLASMPYGTYGGIVWRDAPDKKQRQAIGAGIKDALAGLSIGKAHIADYSGSLDNLGLEGFRSTRHSTQIMALGQLPYTPDRKTMTEILKGEETGGDIRRLNGASDMEAYFNLYKGTEERHGRKKLLYSKDFFEEILRSLMASDKLYWTGIFEGDRMLGAQIHFIDGDMQFYWQAVSGEDVRDYRTDYRLLFDAIRFGQNLGVREINLGASPGDAEGLVFFKKRWGSVQKEYNIYAYTSGLRRMIGR